MSRFQMQAHLFPMGNMRVDRLNLATGVDGRRLDAEGQILRFAVGRNLRDGLPRLLTTVSYIMSNCECQAGPPQRSTTFSIMTLMVYSTDPQSPDAFIGSRLTRADVRAEPPSFRDALIIARGASTSRPGTLPRASPTPRAWRRLWVATPRAGWVRFETAFQKR